MMPLPKVHEAPKTADFSTDSTLKTDNKSVEKKLAPDFWQFRQKWDAYGFFPLFYLFHLDIPQIGGIVNTILFLSRGRIAQLVRAPR